MSDPIAQAAEAMNHQAQAPEVAQLGEPATSSESSTSAASVSDGNSPVASIGLTSTDSQASSAAASSTDPTPPAAGAILAAAPAADVHVPDVSPAPVTGNVLVNSTPTVDAPVIDAPVVEEVASELPHESHLMLLEAKIAMFRAKLVNAERVALDEFESIVGHVKAVL